MMFEDYLDKGIDLVEDGNPQQAIMYLQMALAIEPDDYDVQFYLGQAYYDMEQMQEAEYHFRQASQIIPDEPFPWSYLGGIYEKDNPQQAEEYYLKALACAPDEEDLYCDLGDFYADQQRNKEALENYEKAQLINRNYTRALWGIMFASYYLGLTKKQFDAAKKLTQLFPDDWVPWMHLFECYQVQNKIEKARECCLKMLQLNPDGWHCHAMAGHFYYDVGEYAAAEKQFRRAYELDAECQQETLLMIPLCLIRQNKYKEAVPQLKDMMYYNDQESVAYHLATAYEHLKQYDEAIKAYELELQTRPYSLVSEMCWINMSHCYEKMGQNDEAEAALLRVLEDTEDKDDKWFIFINLAEFYGRQERFEDAIRQYEQALSIDPDDDEVKEMLEIVRQHSQQ